jgi:TRAP-type mannitol/chloroaromatic compound transport system permease large subunit
MGSESALAPANVIPVETTKVHTMLDAMEFCVFSVVSNKNAVKYCFMVLLADVTNRKGLIDVVLSCINVMHLLSSQITVE